MKTEEKHRRLLEVEASKGYVFSVFAGFVGVALSFGFELAQHFRRFKGSFCPAQPLGFMDVHACTAVGTCSRFLIHGCKQETFAVGAF